MTMLLGQAPTLDTNAPDVAAWVTAFAAAFGPIVTAVLGVYFAYLAVRMGLKWARRAA